MIGFQYEPKPSRLTDVSVVSSSTTLPVTVDQVKSEANYTATNQDAVFLRMINASIRQIERYVDMTIVEREYLALFDCVGDYTELPFGPVISVDSVSVASETTTVVDVGNYYNTGSRLFVNDYGSISLGWNYGTLIVAYTAGIYKDDASGILDDDLIEVIIENTVKLWLRGEASAGLDRNIKGKLDLIMKGRFFR